MDKQIIAELAPTGVLRAAVNMANFLLVTGKSASGAPEGVSPSFAAAIAQHLGVPVAYVPFPSAAAAADAATTGVWDIALIGAEPARAEQIAFTAAYAEIQATYLVPARSSITSIADADRPGVRISVYGGSAYDLWLARNIRHAQLVRSPSLKAATQRFVDDQLNALAGLRPGLLSDQQNFPDSKILDGNFTTVQQAVGTACANVAGAAFLRRFVEDAKRSGLIASFIEQHRVRGLSVANLTVD